jgi:hypothetical protein
MYQGRSTRACCVLLTLLAACGDDASTTPTDGATDDGAEGVDAPDAGPCTATLVEGMNTDVPTLGTPRPDVNVFYDDPAYHLPVARVTDGSQVTDEPPPTWIRHEYSRRPAFNADGSRAYMISSNGAGRLYAVAADGSFTYLETIPVNEPDEANWHPTDPNVIYKFDAYGSGLTIKRYDIQTGATTVAADLEDRVHALFPGATGMWTKQEGRPSDDGNIWCLEVGHKVDPGQAFEADGFIAYDLSTDTLLGHMAVTETPDHISTSPKGDYCVPSWGLGLGTRAYKTDFSAFTQLHDRSEHSDLATTKDGDEVLVYTAYDGDDAGDVMMVKLVDGTRTPLFALYGPNHSVVSMHFSGVARDKPGYITASFYGCREDYGNAPCDPTTQWFYDKVVAVELAPSPKIYNLAHTHYGDGGYFAETQATVSADFSKVLFVSTWESTDVADVASYLVRVPACALP